MNDFAAISGQHVAGIRLQVEVCLTIRRGNDPRSHISIWDELVRVSDGDICHVYDNMAHGYSTSSNEHMRVRVMQALQVASGVDPDYHGVRWARMVGVDTDSDDLAERSWGVSLGWISDPDEPRVILYEMTTKTPGRWGVALAHMRDLAGRYPQIVRWIKIGFRFVHVDWYHPGFEEALVMIRRRSLRFKNVDIGDPYAMYTSSVRDKVRMLGWATFFSDGMRKTNDVFIDESGVEIPGVEVSPVTGGVWVIVDEQPTVGDINTGGSFENIRALHERLGRLILRGDDLRCPAWDPLKTKQWLSRWRGAGRAPSRPGPLS